MFFFALQALVVDHPALFLMLVIARGSHLAAAGIGTIPGVDIHVFRVKTVWAMVSAGGSSFRNRLAAILTDKFVIYFFKFGVLQKTLTL